MNKLCLQKASKRLDYGLNCYESMILSDNIEEKKFQWGLIVQSVSNIYAALEQGVKGNVDSKIWFEKIKKIRNTEHLLKYIRFCRNNETHGANETAVKVISSIKFKLSEINSQANVIKTSDGITINSAFAIENDSIKARRNFVGLTTVFDKNGMNPFDPPRAFQGREIDGADAEAVAKCALDYMKSIVDEARQLCSNSD